MLNISLMVILMVTAPVSDMNKKSTTFYVTCTVAPKVTINFTQSGPSTQSDKSFMGNSFSYNNMPGSYPPNIIGDTVNF